VYSSVQGRLCESRSGAAAAARLEVEGQRDSAAREQDHEHRGGRRHLPAHACMPSVAGLPRIHHHERPLVPHLQNLLIIILLWGSWVYAVSTSVDAHARLIIHCCGGNPSVFSCGAHELLR
jgi:hypothetical protein